MFQAALPLRCVKHSPLTSERDSILLPSLFPFSLGLFFFLPLTSRPAVPPFDSLKCWRRRVKVQYFRSLGKLVLPTRAIYPLRLGTSLVDLPPHFFPSVTRPFPTPPPHPFFRWSYLHWHMSPPIFVPSLPVSMSENTVHRLSQKSFHSSPAWPSGRMLARILLLTSIVK